MLRYAQCFTEKNRRRNSLHKQEIQAPQTPVSSTNKTDRHDVTEIFLKVAFNTIALIEAPPSQISKWLVPRSFKQQREVHLIANTTKVSIRFCINANFRIR
jgi:hypothetical protein